MSFSFAGIVRDNARHRPTSTALVFADQRLSWIDLDRRSSALANVLTDQGVQPGDRVAVLMKNAPAFHEIAFACSKLDVAVVGLNWRLSSDEVLAILLDAAPRLVLIDEEHAGLIPAIRQVMPGVALISLGHDYEQRLGDADARDPGVNAAKDSAALILYSSGTTGLPKGIVLTNDNLSYTRRMATELFRMTAQSVHLVASPLFHIGGAGTGTTLMTIGGTTVLMRESDPESILDTIARERVTHAFFVPAVIQRLVDLQTAAPRDLGSLDVISYGAAPMTEHQLRRSMNVLGCGFLGCYGMTETAGTATALFPEEHAADGERSQLLRSVGRPLSWIDLRIVNPETGEDAEPGKTGEIWIRSAANMAGYLNKPTETERTLLAGGWLRTGDGAYRDSEGYIFLQDRLKDMIISGGENIYPIEVENVLAEHPVVKDVAVIGVPDERWGETVKAIVIAQPHCEIDPAELISFSRARLAHYKCPTSVTVVAELPRNATGKVLKKVLREQFAKTP